VKAILVGEALMRMADPAAGIAALLGTQVTPPLIIFDPDS